MLMENLCSYNGIISRCAEDKWANQINCPHSVKSATRNCCMYWAEDNRCDSLAAQQDRDEKIKEPEEPQDNEKDEKS